MDRPLRIAMVVSAFPKLSETFILAQITGLLDRGHEVDIYARQRPVEAYVQPQVDSYGLLDHTWWIASAPRGKGALRWKALRLTAESWVRAPIRTMRLLRAVLRRRPFCYRDLFMGLPLVRRNYDFVLCHFGTTGRFLRAYKEAFRDVPFGVMFHGSDVLAGAEKGPDFYSELFDLADVLLANSDYTRRRLIELGAQSRKVEVVYVPVALEEPAPEDAPPRGRGPVQILSVGRLVAEKGFVFGIEALARLVKQRPDLDVQYRIVGEGPLEGAVRQMAEDLGLEGRVCFAGAMDRPATLRAMAESDIFLLPSVSEGLGVAAIEAQWMGLPVVATSVGGIPEAVVPGRSAVLAPAGDCAALAEALMQVIDRPDTWSRMAAAGREHVAKRFAADIVNGNVEALIRRYAERSGRSGIAPGRSGTSRTIGSSEAKG